MTKITRDVHVEAPPAQVFAVLAEIERLPEFSDMTVDVTEGPGRPLRPGDRFKQVIRVAGVKLPTEWEVTEVVPNELIRVDGLSRANGRAALIDRLAPDGEGTRVTLEIDYDLPGGAVGGFVDRFIVARRSAQEAERILGRLKGVCEHASATR